MFSDYCIGNANKYKIKIRGVQKLVRNLVNKSEYVLHYINLQSYFLNNEISKASSSLEILKFKQSI